MKIEAGLKHFSPKSMHISDSPKATASASLTGTDVMAAFGLCQSKSPLGTAALLAKAGISPNDREKAIQLLMQRARKIVPPLVAKAAGAKLTNCLMVLSSMAFYEYSRSAGSTKNCNDCDGRGVINSIANVMVHPGCGEKTPPKYRLETTEKKCVTCHGKGVIAVRCRCGGTGKVRDIEKSKRLGVPVDKDCERCKGVGYQKSPGTKAYRAVSVYLPDLQARTWNRNWKPFFELLVAVLISAERHADEVFRVVTTHSELSSVVELSKLNRNK